MAQNNTFPVVTTYFYRIQTRMFFQKVVFNIFLITETINMQLDNINYKNIWHLVFKIANHTLILNTVNDLGTGSGIDGKCTSPENVPECADYYADNPDVVKRPAVGQSDRPERVRTNRYY